MLMYMPYVIGFLVLVGILILVLCHKPLWKVAKAGLIIVGCGIVLALTIIVSGNLITFDTLSDAMLFLNGTSALLECEGEKSAIVIPQQSVGDNGDLFWFFKKNDKWKIKNAFSSGRTPQQIIVLPQYCISFFTVSGDDGMYILIEWLSKEQESVHNISDTINSKFLLSEKDFYNIGLTYIPKITEEYELYIDGEQIDLSSLKMQTDRNSMSIPNRYWWFFVLGLIFFTIIGGIIAYSVWLRKRRQPRGLRR